MNPNVPKNLIAVKDGSPDVMGYFTMFSVPDQFVSVSKLGRAWASQGLPSNLIPHSRAAVDTFKNACRSAETRRAGSANRVTEVKVDQVQEDNSECVYQVTYMVRDTTQRVIEHPKAMRVVFDKHQEVIDFDTLSKRYEQALIPLQEAIQAHYDANAEKVPSHKVRHAIRALMTQIGAVNVRRKAGGIYFVPKSGRTDVDSLVKVLDYLYDDEAEAHLIPCASDKYQQEMVQRHFELSVSSEVDETISRVAEKLIGGSRKMRHDAVGNLFARRMELGKLRDKYAAMVGDDLATTNAKLELLDEQLRQLVEKQGS